MSLEISTFISGLTPTWPVSGDPKSQGDDHIRLIKSVLQSTFPNATKAFYMPSATAVSNSMSVLVSHQNQTLFCSTTGGAYTLTLPALTAGDAGWQVSIMKYTTDSSFMHVVPASGNINSQAGATSLIRIGQVCKAATFIWSGGAWFCTKDGGMIGETVNWDGSSIPPGYLALDGSAYDTVSFCELAAMLGTSVLRDKRGRAEIGAGTGSGLTNRVNGGTYGVEGIQLAAGHIPSLTSSGNNNISVNGSAVTGVASLGTGYQAGGFGPPAGPAGASPVNSTGTNTIVVSYSNPSPSAFGLLQPSIGTQKLVRAC